MRCHSSRRHVAHLFEAALAGVVDQDVESAELAIHGGEERAGVFDPADIGYGAEDSAEALHFRNGSIDGCLRASADGDGGAIVQQAFGDGAADAAGAAGDDRILALE